MKILRGKARTDEGQLRSPLTEVLKKWLDIYKEGCGQSKILGLYTYLSTKIIKMRSFKMITEVISHTDVLTVWLALLTRKRGTQRFAKE